MKINTAKTCFLIQLQTYLSATLGGKCALAWELALDESTVHQEGASQLVVQLKHNLLFTDVCWCQKNTTLVFITLNSIGHVMWLNWGIRWLWVQVIVHSIGEGSGHTLHVNNQAMIILLVPLSKGKMFWGCWPIWRRVKIPLFISTCTSCSPFGSKPPSPKSFLAAHQLISTLSTAI